MAEFNLIVAEFGPALARVAASYERDPALREDLVQEILLAVSRALPRLQHESRLKAFLFRIAHNKGVDHVARHAAAPRTEELSDGFVVDGASPEDGLIDRQRTERLMMAMRNLDLPHRQVIALLLEDLNYAEIADALGISVSNVGVRVNRAKARLRSLLTDD